MAATILFSGYYGFGNVGDEAVLAGTLAELRRQAPEVKVVVLSAAPDATEEMHGVAAVPRMNLVALRRALGDADVVVSGGGGLLQDVTSLRSLLYYSGILKWARRRAKPTMIYAQSIGPLTTALGRRIASGVLSRCRAITVRDQASAEVLAGLGIPSKRVEVTADPALLLQPPEGEVPRRGGADGTPTVAVSLRPWKGAEAQVETLCEAVATWTRRAGLTLTLLPFHPQMDLPLLEKVAGRLNAPIAGHSGHPGQVSGIISQVDAVIGMRLHSLILAAGVGVPFCGVSYDPKVAAFARECSMPEVSLADISLDRACEAFEQMWANRDSLRSRIAAWLPSAQDRARRNVTILLDVLQNQETSRG